MSILRTCNSALSFVLLVSLAGAGQPPQGMPQAGARVGSQAGSNHGSITCDASGVVVNATSGDLIRRAQIRLKYQQGTNAITATTDAEGQYLFSGVQSGQYQLAVHKKGYLDALLEIAVCPAGERSNDELSQRVWNITPVRLAPLSAISGRVTDDIGEPVLGAVVHAKQVNGTEGTPRTVASARTDDLGMYRLYGLRPGGYYVTAGPPDESPGGPESTTGDSDEDYEASYYPQGTEPGAASVVSVGIATAASGIDIQLIRGVSENRPVVLLSAVSSSVSDATAASDQISTVALHSAKAEISGTLVNATTSEPVRHAKVTLEPTRNGGASYGAQTDAIGHFEIKDIDAGSYRAVIEHAGYLPTPHRSGVPNEIPVSLTLKPKQRLQDVVLRATPSSVLTGRVFDQDGDPAQGFQVQAVRYGFVNGKRQLQTVASSITNDLGEYRLYGLSPGQFYVSAGVSTNESQNGPEGPERYVGTYYPQALDVEGAAPIVVHEGEQVPGINIWAKLSRLVELRGRVVSPFGPLKSGDTVVTITRASAEAAEISFNATQGTDAEGHFQFAGIPPGTYALAAVYNDEGGQFAAAETLEVRNTIDNIDLPLNRGMVVTGRMQTEGGTISNLKSLRVMLQPDTSMPTGPVEGDLEPDGTFSVAGVLPDQYTVEVFGLPDEYYLKAVHAGAQESSGGRIDFKQPAGPLSIVVRLGATISGSVVDNDQQPAVATNVVLVPTSQQTDERQAYKTVVSDREGKFRFVGLAPGTYQLFAITGVDPNSYMNPDFIASVQNFAVSVTVQDNSAPQSELRLELASSTE